MNRVVTKIGERKTKTLIQVGVSALLLVGFILGTSSTAEARPKQFESRPKQFSVTVNDIAR